MPFKKSNKFADRGKDAEKAVQKVLEAWVAEDPVHREFNRLVDTKAAGRTIKAAAADFEYYALLNPSYERYYGLVEVKETEHEYRLVRDKVPQLPALRKRANAGGLCAVLVYHSTLGRWRVVTPVYLSRTGDKGSWNLSQEPLYEAPRDALAAALPAFGC